MKDKKININDVATYTNVSKSTVSNYLNGRFENMSYETRTKISRAIEELNYTPSLSARRLSMKGRSKTICVIIPHNIIEAFDSIFFTETLRAIGNITEKIDYNVIIFAEKRGKLKNNIEYLKGMASSVVDGFIIFDLEQKDMYFKEFEKSNIPYVCVGKIPGFTDYNYVASDHKQAIIDATTYLIKLGHTNIGLITEQKDGVVTKYRIDGYTSVLNTYNILPNEKNIICSDQYINNSNQVTYEQCKQLLEQEERPTAIIISSAHINGAMQAISEKNINIPEQLSIIVVDYYDNYDFMGINFTKINSKAYEVTTLACKKLLRNIFNPNSVFQSELLKLKLTVGDTTRLIKNN